MTPPRLDPARVAALVKDHFGVAGRLTSLQAERDQIFHVEGAREMLLRISPIEEAPETLAFQIAVSVALQAADPSLPVPQPIPTRQGESVASFVDDGRIHPARLFTYLPGRPVAGAARSAAQRRALGATLARLDRALAQSPLRAGGNPSLWNVAQADQLLTLLDGIGARAHPRLARRVLERFTAFTRPRLAALPWQVVHNDFNPKNVLVDPLEPSRITGIVDFGDAVFNPHLVDLAVAVARQITTSVPVDEACELVAAYHAVVPLARAEIALLPGTIAARLAMRLVIWGARHAEGDARSDVAVLDDAAALLDALLARGEDGLTDLFEQACAHGADASAQQGSPEKDGA